MKILRIHSSKQRHNYSALWALIKKNHISAHSVNLAYTFLFSLFPLLVILSYALGHWDLRSSTGKLFLQNVLPSPIYSLLEGFLQNARLVDLSQVAGAAALSLYSCARIARSLRRKMRLIYGLPSDRGPLADYVIAFVFSLLLLLGLLLSLAALVAGEWLFEALREQIPLNGFFVRFWLLARFGLVGSFIFVLFFVLYRFLPGISLTAKQAAPGALFSSIFWVLLSVGFSFYVDNLHDYSLIYGSVGVVMILLLWLYLSNFVLLSGVCLNLFLDQKKNKN